MTIKSSIRHLYDLLDKPELIWRPQQITTFLSPKPAHAVTVKMPWQLAVTVYPDDQIGEIVRKKGLYDLIVCEAIWRLVKRGSIVLDVGANLGYMTSIMALQAGSTGTVLAFEPHPGLHKQLSKHIDRWRKEADVTNISLIQAAVSNVAGEARLLEPTGFAGNRAISKLSTISGDDEGSYFDVETVTLDSICEKYDTVDLAKIDVEGAEMLVLTGAQQLFNQHKLRNVIVEEFQPYPNERLSFLEDRGYRIFSLGRNLLGPRLCEPTKPEGLRWGESPSYLATIDADSALRRFGSWGWECLSNKLN